MPSTPRHSVLHPHGTLICTPADGSRETQQDTLKCCHCQRVMIFRKGSGRHLGHCAKCAAPTCDSPECTSKCLPFEKALDLYEAQQILCLPGDLPRARRLAH